MKRKNLIEKSKKTMDVEKKTSMLKEIVDVVRESCEETTAHGVPHIMKRENVCIKAVWIVCFLLSSLGCSYLVYSSIHDYIQWNTVTKLEIVQELPTLFPTVSICNLNSFTTNYSFEFFQSILLKNKLIMPGLSYEIMNPFLFRSNLESLKYFTRVNVIASNLTDAEKQLFGPKLEDILLSCMYNLKPCNLNDFDWYYDAYFGNCFRFNAGKNMNGQIIPDKVTTKAGKPNGLLLELFVGDPTQMSMFGTTKGAHVNIHNKTQMPIFFDGVDVPTGRETNVVINRDFTSKISYPYSKCIDDIYSSDLLFPSLLKTLNYSYRQSDCFLLCYQKYVIQKCGCYDPSVKIWLTGMKPCSSLKDLYCDINFFSKFFTQNVESICSQDCPLECESYIYHVYTSSADYPTTGYAKYLVDNKVLRSKFSSANITNMTYNTIKQNVVALNVYYDTISYKHFYELKKTSLLDLVANIGGTMGLFIGISFLSFVEIIDALIMIIITLFKRLIQPNKNKVSNSKILM